ncbi:MAG: beta-aspartyl-peptidase [Candidatus Saccharicenans sp.]|jgi:beta-aspartyl-dipeptidase (metallo-type)|nr:beta-aspartyl-peptidase [Candidatus Saccharicenans sp.]HUM34495.1 beta-aspartyl-peptidase [Candidatus Saccharicenans sp.]
MFKLVNQVKVLSPEDKGVKDILIAAEKIAAIEEPGKIKIEGLEVERIDGSGLVAIPGFIDPHVHILGGGGEGGPATRAPEIRVEDCALAGVTSVIGCLGTDSITRHLSSLLAKARALEIEGLNAWIYVGAYNLPTPTITGSVRSDLVLIDKVIGAGEIALSDHRSSQPTYEDFLQLVAECRVGGMLGGKAGIAHFHLGDGKHGLDYLFRMIKETEIPSTQVIPTHTCRNRHLFSQALDWLSLGGFIDLTTGPEPQDEEELSVIEALKQIKAAHLPLSRVTVSSDSNGSLPVFNQQGQLVGLTVANQKDFLQAFQKIWQEDILTWQEAIQVFSTNAARFYKLSGKGQVMPGFEADLLLIDEAAGLQYVFSRGKILLEKGQLKARGTFSC